MEEILSKRIILLTNAIIILSAIGFLALIHHVDARYKEKEYVALNALRNCIESVPPNADNADISGAAAKNWLKQKKTDLYNQQILLADEIALELEKAGFSKQVKTYKHRNGNTDVNPGNTGFLLLNVIGTDTGNCCEHGFGNLNGNHKLMYFIQQYKHLKTGTKFRIATGMKPNSVADALAKSSFSNSKDKFAHELNPGGIPEEVPDEIIPVQKDVSISSFEFTWDSCKITLTGNSPFLQGETIETITIPVEAKTIDGPSWMELYTIDTIYNKLGDKTELQKIVRHYGDLPMDKAVDMIGNDYMDAFENVDVFGFSFSTTSLPLALLVFFLFLSTGIFLMIKEAGKLKLKVISEFNNEDITDYFIKRPLNRTIIWLFLPILSLLATLPVLPEEIEKLVILGTGAVILGVLNIASLMRAKKL